MAVLNNNSSVSGEKKYKAKNCEFEIWASPTSQLILQPFPRFTYITAHSPTLPLLHLHHSSFFNPSFASPTSQDFHLRHLASRPCAMYYQRKLVISDNWAFIRHFTYITAHSPTLFSLFLCNSSSRTSPGEPPCSWNILKSPH